MVNTVESNFEDVQLTQDGEQVAVTDLRLMVPTLDNIVVLAEPDDFVPFANASYLISYKCSPSCLGHKISCQLISVNHAQTAIRLRQVKSEAGGDDHGKDAAGTTWPPAGHDPSGGPS